ncbi:MAG: hypothetical protein JSS27_20900 [Planctomycetes bacterium]|nr:hypothetical protein [Planctomycetota bacterium]
MIRMLAGCLLLTLVLIVAASTVATPPPANTAGGVTDLTLQEQLEKGLRARRPVEFQYIAQIVAQVEAGTLPRELIDTTFIAARKRPRHQLQYFQFILQSRARALGYSTPDLSAQMATVTP